MKDLQILFPRASQAFLEANESGTSPPIPPQPRSERIPNKTEREFSFILEAQKRAGAILRYEFEGITLRWNGLSYTPDFVVFEKTDTVMRDGHEFITRLKLIEVKGPFIKGNRERAVERFRHARTYWTLFSFELHQRTKQGWRRLY